MNVQKRGSVPLSLAEGAVQTRSFFFFFKVFTCYFKVGFYFLPCRVLAGLIMSGLCHRLKPVQVATLYSLHLVPWSQTVFNLSQHKLSGAPLFLLWLFSWGLHPRPI